MGENEFMITIMVGELAGRRAWWADFSDRGIYKGEAGHRKRETRGEMITRFRTSKYSSCESTYCSSFLNPQPSTSFPTKFPSLSTRPRFRPLDPRLPIPREENQHTKSIPCPRMHTPMPRAPHLPIRPLFHHIPFIHDEGPLSNSLRSSTSSIPLIYSVPSYHPPTVAPDTHKHYAAHSPPAPARRGTDGGRGRWICQLGGG